MKLQAGQGCLEYLLALVLMGAGLFGLMYLATNHEWAVFPCCGLLWVFGSVAMSLGCAGEYLKELEKEGLQTGTLGKKLKFGVVGLFSSLVLGASLAATGAVCIFGASFQEFKLENLVTSGPPWAVSHPDIYADEANIELRICFPLGVHPGLELSGLAWKNILRGAGPGFEKHLPVLSWRQEGGRKFVTLPAKHASETSPERARYEATSSVFLGKSNFSAGIPVTVRRVFQTSTGGEMTVTLEITQIPFPILGWD